MDDADFRVGLIFLCAGSGFAIAAAAVSPAQVVLFEGLAKVAIVFVAIGEYCTRSAGAGFRRWPICSAPPVILYVLGETRWAIGLLAATIVILALQFCLRPRRKT